MCRFSNAEGEEYLRQRRRQLPFSFTTGEAVLYDTGPTVDFSQFQFNKAFPNVGSAENVAPGSLLDSFLKQDEAAYTNTPSSPLPVEQVFVNSRALLSIPSEAWRESGAVTGVLKEEASRSMMAVIDNLENGDLCSVLQSLDVNNWELSQWEDALSRLSQSQSQSEGHCGGVGSQLESVFTSDVFDCIDSILFKGSEEDLGGTHPSCFGHQQEPPWFPTPSPESTYSTQTFNSTRKLSHLPAGMEPVLPQLDVPEASATFQSCMQMRVGQPSQQILVHPQAGLQSDTELLQRAVEQQLADIYQPLVSCTDFEPPAGKVPLPECLKTGPPLQTCSRQVQEWQPSQPPMPLAGVKHYGREQAPACHGPMSENDIWQNDVPKLTPGQQGGLACSRAASQGSCMFDQHFCCSPTGGDVAALSSPRWADMDMDQSPPQGSCYFQWSHGKPVVGSSAISQEDVSVSPPSHPSTAAPTEHAYDIQPRLDCHRQTLASDRGLQNGYKMNVKGANK